MKINFFLIWKLYFQKFWDYIIFNFIFQTFISRFKKKKTNFQFFSSYLKKNGIFYDFFIYFRKLNFFNDVDCHWQNFAWMFLIFFYKDENQNAPKLHGRIAYLNPYLLSIPLSLAQLVWIMHNICKVWGSNPEHHQKKSLIY